MPMHITYTDDNGILARAEGIVTGREIKEVNEKIYFSPEEIKNISYQIIDFREASGVEVTNAEIEDLDRYPFHYNSFLKPDGLKFFRRLKDSFSGNQHFFRKKRHD